MTENIEFLKSKIARTIGFKPFRTNVPAQVLMQDLIQNRGKLSQGLAVDVDSLHEWCDFLHKDEQDLAVWLNQDTSELFTYRDCMTAYWTKRELKVSSALKNLNEEERLATYALCDAVCILYYKFNNFSLEEAYDRAKYAPLDFTRPHGWANVQYVGYGEALAALLYRIDLGSDSYYDEVSHQFTLQFSMFPSQYTQESLKIPYAFYAKCWDEAHSVKKIQPWSIEICVYYVQQNQLPLKFIFDQKAPESFQQENALLPGAGSQQTGRGNSKFFLWPSFKYFDVFCLMRFLAAWELWTKIFHNLDALNSWPEEAFKQHCEKKFQFSQAPANNQNPSSGFWSMGIELQNHCDSFQDLFEHSLSFFGDVFNWFSCATLLEAQIKSFHPFWRRNQKKSLTNPKLQRAVEKLFQKQHHLQDTLKSLNSTTLDEVDRKPKWPVATPLILSMTKTFPVTAEHVEMMSTQTQANIKEAWPWVYKDFLAKYSKRLQFSELMCLFDKKDVNEGDEREEYALNAMTVIIPNFNRKVDAPNFQGTKNKKYTVEEKKNKSRNKNKTKKTKNGKSGCFGILGIFKKGKTSAPFTNLNVVKSDEDLKNEYLADIEQWANSLASQNKKN